MSIVPVGVSAPLKDLTNECAETSQDAHVVLHKISICSWEHCQEVKVQPDNTDAPSK